jgi:hypothetical protein
MLQRSGLQVAQVKVLFAQVVTLRLGAFRAITVETARMNFIGHDLLTKSAATKTIKKAIHSWPSDTNMPATTQSITAIQN